MNNLDDINKGLDDINDDEIRNKVISVLNNYAFIDNKKEALELIINDLKNTYFEDGNTSVKIARLDDYFTDDDYVFLLGFNKENIPILYKDDEYFIGKCLRLNNLEMKKCRSCISNIWYLDRQNT